MLRRSSTSPWRLAALTPAAFALTVAFLATAVSSPAARAGEVPVTHSLDEAVQQARETGKPILIDFFATWCGPCKRFDADLKKEAALQKALEPVVLLELDAEKGQGRELAQKYEVKGFPTYVMLDAEQRLLDRWMGYERADFLRTIAAAFEDLTPLDAKRDRFHAEPNAADARALARYHYSRNEGVAAVKMLQRAAELDEDDDTDYVYPIFESVTSGYRNGHFTRDDVRAAADAVLARPKHRPEQALFVGLTMAEIARESDTLDLMVPYVEAGMRETRGTQDRDLLAYRKMLEVDHALYVEKDVPKAIALRRARLPEGWENDADALNGFAWWCFENKVNLEEAEALARKGVEVAPAGKTRAMVLDTLAEICNARGSCKDAVLYIEQAMKEDPASSYYPKQLERFQKLLAAQKGAPAQEN